MTLQPHTSRNPREDHYLSLEGAMLVPTAATRTTHAHLRTVIKARGIMCVHGRVGTGKTVAVTTTLRDLAPHHTVHTTSPRLALIRETLHQQMGLPGEPPTKAAAAHKTLRHALSERPWIVVCDEAQMLDTKAFEFFRGLWDDPDTQLALVFIGTDNTHAKIRARPALSSRVLAWQQFGPLTPREVATVIPQYHPLWADVGADDIQWINDLACHGNFRNWARITYLLQEARRDQPDRPLDRKLIRYITRSLDGTSGEPD